MKSEINNIELVENFPCLMEYKIQGDLSAGTYLVSKKGITFSVCLLSTTHNVSSIGEMHHRTVLDPKEWFHLPKGTVVKLINE